MGDLRELRVEFERIDEVDVGLAYPVYEGQYGWFGIGVCPYEGKA